MKNSSLLNFSTPSLLQKEITLLEAIDEFGSISKAAKAVPISYKIAWQMVDSMNNLSKEPIVIKAVGGKQGGGTKLTTYGKKLIKDYYLLKREYDRFLDTLKEMDTIKRLALKLSARNQLYGKIVEIKKDRASSEVSFELKSGVVLKSIITLEAANELELDIGDEIVGIIKASSIIISNKKDFKKRVNIFKGVVEDIERGNITSNIKLHIDNLDKFWITGKNSLLEELDIEVSKSAYIFIRPKDVLIGK